VRLGPCLEEGGVRFNLFARGASAVDLVLFDEEARVRGRLAMDLSADHVWTAFAAGEGPGTCYGFQVDGPWDPAAGKRFNRELLLIDPYARALTGRHDGSVDDYTGHVPASPLERSGRTNVDRAPRCVVVDDAFDWGDERAPGHTLDSLVIYELHVSGFTKHPSSGVERPGSFLGLVEKIPYLVDLGVNAVELLPVHHAFTERRLRDLGLENYWGYNPVAFFAPDTRFACSSEPGAVVDEFKTLVLELHRASIEVILDVVFNHTGEQDETGPTLSLRGIDNESYYLLEPGDRGRYVNWTGCGNTLDFSEPVVVKLAIDCLACWAREMHVDGFRFDLAPVLGRNRAGEFSASAPFFEAVRREPALEGVKLIAEPWDMAPVSPVVTGGFPPGWAAWNDEYRNALRRFMKGDGATARRMASCVEGSRGVFSNHWQSASSSINLVTCHDGFTLADLVSYAHKHNEANGEGGRDGEERNHSWNSGVEGPTDDPDVRALRDRRVRNLLATLLTSRGVPMILAGDEFLRTQGGNNNAYCQDNEISWVDWSLLEDNAGFQSFVSDLIALRREHPVLRLDGDDGMTFLGSREDAVQESGEPEWTDAEIRAFAFHLDGGRCTPPDDDLFVILNAHWEPRSFTTPGGSWVVLVDTDRPGTGSRPVEEGETVRVAARSVVVLCSKRVQ
jgi:glycogen operon protein